MVGKKARGTARLNKAQALEVTVEKGKKKRNFTRFELSCATCEAIKMFEMKKEWCNKLHSVAVNVLEGQGILEISFGFKYFKSFGRNISSLKYLNYLNLLYI